MKKSLRTWSGITLVIDIGWGDAGKGKLVDVLAQTADMVVRYSGGDNAGHTVKNRNGTFKFGLIPSGIFSKSLCVLERGMVINPTTLTREIVQLRKKGFPLTPQNLLISKDAHLIMPWHKERDILQEIARGGGKIGTTGRGIGPAYADRTERVGLQMADVLLPEKELTEKLHTELVWQTRLVRLMKNDTREILFDKDQILSDLIYAKKIFGEMITNVTEIVWKNHRKHKKILGEGAQGMLLDIDQGTYPYVTSSNPGVIGFERATGILSREVSQVVGVTRAYTARVGTGAMPTELRDETGNIIRERGVEYGTQTGRPRRCGWFDAVALAYGAQRGGIDSIAVTKLDILDVFPKVKMCVAYRDSKTGRTYKSGSITDMSDSFLTRMKPIYKELDGWQTDTSNAQSFTALPKNAQKYLHFMEKLLGFPFSFVSVGPDRAQSFFC